MQFNNFTTILRFSSASFRQNWDGVAAYPFARVSGCNNSFNSTVYSFLLILACPPGLEDMHLFQQ
jgi:hypothetical protein